MAGNRFTERALSKWMEGTGPASDVVISSRVRLARNLVGIPFPAVADEEASRKVANLVAGAVTRMNQDSPQPFSFVSLAELPVRARQVLVEKHLISPEHAGEGAGRAVVIREDEAVSIMVNEEDHLRIQCLVPGLQLDEAWALANRIDDQLEADLDYAFAERTGYLTACPTNAGTGMRASVMVHLPALVLTNQAGNVLSAVGKVGLLVRGLYGEGSEAIGNIFQISNQITLGTTEEETIENLRNVVQQVIDSERQARDSLLREMREQLEDRVCRAFGTLTNARIISSQEAMQLLSDVRLGVDLSILTGIAPSVLNELLVATRPWFLQQQAGKELSPFERDLRRAALIRGRLKDQAAR
ncbi:MAG: protein arginine kinase [Chloroflexota bacterium]